MRRNRGNLNEYLQEKVERELDHKLSSMIDKRLKNINVDNYVHNKLDRHQRNVTNEFGRTMYNNHLYELNPCNLFGNSSSQFMNTFSHEIQRSLFRNM
jgi:hypothetical protein